MIRQAVLLVGGRGTRLWPLTADRPKGLIPVTGTPFLDLQLQLLRQVGVEEVILAVGTSHLGAWEAYAADDHNGIDVSLTVETSPLDTAGALVASVERLDERFLVLNGDVVIETDLSGFVSAAGDAEAALALSRVEDTSAYGVVVTDDLHRVEAFVEKPPPGTAPADTVSAGIYVMSRSVFEGRPQGPLSFERAVFPELAAEQRLFAHVVDGSWLDIGTPRLLLDTHDHVMRGRSQLLPRNDAGRDWVWVDETAKVDDTAEVVRSVVMEGAVIGAGAKVADAVIGPEADIGTDVTVRGEAVVGPRAVIGPGVELDAGIRVGPAAVIGADSVRFSPPE